MRKAVVIVALAAMAVMAQQQGMVAIRDARVVIGTGAVLEKGTVLIKDGIIAEVGAQVNVPAAAWVIDGKGLTVYPGLIDAMSTWGIPEAATPAAATTGGRGQGQQQTPQTPSAPAAAAATTRSMGPQDRPGTNSWVKAADLVRPTDRRVEQARSAGFTTAVTFPRQGLIGGHGAIVNLAGETGGQMVVEPSAGLWMSLTPSGYSGYPASQMGVFAYFRQLWIDLDYYKLAKEAYAKSPQTVPRPAYDRALEGLAEARRLLMPATGVMQFERTAKLSGELKTPVVFYGALEGYRMADEIKKSGAPVVLSVRWPVRERDSDPDEVPTLRTLELRDKAPTTPAALAAAGVKFAVTSDGVESPREVIRALKKSIDLGFKKEDALRALTLSAAEIYGVADRLGSVEKGKIANLLVIDGDLFDEKMKVQMVFIDGVKYLPAPEAPQTPAGAAGMRRPTDEQEEER